MKDRIPFESYDGRLWTPKHGLDPTQVNQGDSIFFSVRKSQYVFQVAETFIGEGRTAHYVHCMRGELEQDFQTRRQLLGSWTLHVVRQKYPVVSHSHVVSQELEQQEADPGVHNLYAGQVVPDSIWLAQNAKAS